MSSNPLMMGYEGGDLLQTGVGQRSGRCPGLCVQAVGGGLGGQRLRARDESALEVAPPDRKSTFFTFLYLPACFPYPGFGGLCTSGRSG